MGLLNHPVTSSPSLEARVFNSLARDRQAQPAAVGALAKNFNVDAAAALLSQPASWVPPLCLAVAMLGPYLWVYLRRQRRTRPSEDLSVDPSAFEIRVLRTFLAWLFLAAGMLIGTVASAGAFPPQAVAVLACVDALLMLTSAALVGRGATVDAVCGAWQDARDEWRQPLDGHDQ